MKRSLARAMVLALLLPSIASDAGRRARQTRPTTRRPMSAAEAASKEAASLRNQWTVTVSALAAAKKAADGGDFDRAVAAAKEAEALAKASIFQATTEKEAWKAMEIR